MARLNTAAAAPAVTSALATETAPTGTTALGAPGYGRDPHGELYVLGVGYFAGESAHHESADARRGRFIGLVRTLAVSDPDWTARFLRWLRGTGIRTAALIGACEFVKARKDAGIADDDHIRREPGLGRRVIDSVCQRADEPGEIIAYWTASYGRSLPQAIRKGVADAARRLWNERGLLKWDGDGRAWRFGDVLSLTHARPTSRWQSTVFRHALDRRYGNLDAELPAEVVVLSRRRELMNLPVEARRAWLLDHARQGDVGTALREAGMTWESLAGWLQGPLDAAAWEAVIPAMYCGALLRNLRNFDEAGVADAVAEKVAAKITDPGEIAAAKLMPFQFLAAYRAAPSLRWSWHLEKGLNASLRNVPALPGRTLVLVDRSPSMDHSMSERSTMTYADSAAVFGAAVAARAEDADLVEFGETSRKVPFRPADSLLVTISQFSFIGGTDIPAAVRAHFRDERHDRVVIVTDEQTRPGQLPYYRWSTDGRYRYERDHLSIDDLIPASVPVYVWNLGGYERGFIPTGSGNRHCLAGLTDDAFRVIPLLEQRRSTGWPF